MDSFEDEEESDDVPEWTTHVMATLAAEVRRRRKERGMSAQELADACSAIGHPIPRNVIANMESGRRSVLPLVDVIVLAEALGTHPALLIYPLGHVSEVQRLPLQHPTATWDAMSWFTGESGFGLDAALVRAFRAKGRQESAAFNAWNDMRSHHDAARRATDPARREEAERDADQAIKRLKAAAASLRTTRSRIQRILGPTVSVPPGLETLTADIPDGKDSI
ncbi:helix-turn-helix domain-containing protein [Actinacidiphila epipremni]|jgi:transcriptional regulator with XRE-family HTH domain|uniref:Helix-turn-helix transcriptional regulator n=1 Tax=Actinacidiphila epipremni TaxID=2053013 RepID=A0ABX0ZK98_9ACTN|nr:helix-turn-helix transcriptional regulator [Actinacidiphila epipremni]NJP43237.1 helix-turn-helix transcriptional regulator [Actinacidiphila epipremni]